MRPRPRAFHGGGYCQGSPQVSIKLQMILWKAKRGRERDGLRMVAGMKKQVKRQRRAARTVKNPIHHGTHSSPLLSVLFVSKTKLDAVGWERKSERDRKREEEPPESNDRLIAITLVRQQWLPIGTFLRKISRLRKIRSELDLGGRRKNKFWFTPYKYIKVAL